MPNKDGTDILMQICTDSGAVEAECQTQVDASDTFANGFSNGTFFEVESFGFGMKIDEQDATKDTVANSNGQQGNKGAPIKDKDKKKDKTGAFMRWKTASPADLKTMKRYPVRMDEFDITRLYDAASPVLFKYCCDSGSFKTATLIKRKDVGGTKLQGFLRLEFSDILVTHIGWQNEEVVKEKFKFVFRKIVVRYCATAHRKGSPVANLQEMPSVTWSYETEVVNSQQSL